VDEGGFSWLTPKGVREDFAQDLSAADQSSWQRRKVGRRSKSSTRSLASLRGKRNLLVHTSRPGPNDPAAVKR